MEQSEIKQSMYIILGK